MQVVLLLPFCFRINGSLLVFADSNYPSNFNTTIFKNLHILRAFIRNRSLALAELIELNLIMVVEQVA